MSQQSNAEGWPASESDKILSSLLDAVDLAIETVRTKANGCPLFVVEAELVRVLRDMVPDAKFTAADIRNWSAGIAS